MINWSPVGGLVLTLMLGLSISGCSLNGGGDGYDNAPSDLRLRIPAGHGTRADLDRELPRVLGNYGYMVERDEGDPEFRILTTQWKRREPYLDERMIGIDVVETRLVIWARGVRPYHTITVGVENRALFGEDGEWHEAPISPSLERYGREIANEVRREISDGIRTY